MTEQAGYELFVERVIDAPRDAVWKAWTEHFTARQIAETADA